MRRGFPRSASKPPRLAECAALKGSRRARGATAIALLVSLLGHGITLGQTPAPAPAQPATSVLAPVVVTATRIEAAPFDVPASIDRIDGDAVRNNRAQVNISESLGAVPGLQARDRQNYAQDVQISVRGFGARASFGLRGVRVYVDGIPATFPDGQGQITNVDLGSVDRIEVLRGPSSALYGNSAGGVIQVFTEDGAERPTFDFGLAAGSDGVLRANTKLSGNTGAIGYVLSASHFETDGYRDHSAVRRNIANAKLTLHVDDSSTVTLIANSVTMPRAQDPLGLTRAQYEANRRSVDPSAITFDTRKSIDQTQFGLIWERRLDSANSLRLMLYRGHRNTEQFQAIAVAAQTSLLSPGGVISLGTDYTGTDLRWTLRGNLAERPFTLVSGFAVDSLDQRRRGYRNFTGAGATLVTGIEGDLRRDENDSALAVDPYVQTSWEFAPRWTLSAGVRRSSVRISSADRFIVGVNGDDSGSTRYSATLPVFGLMYAVNDVLHVYASAGRGFETPTLNELAYRPDGTGGLNFALQPATSRNLEVGAKARLGAWGELSAAVFAIRTRSEIVTLTNISGRSTYQNAGATQRTGVELGWTATLAPSLQAQIAASTVDARYRDGFSACYGSPCSAPVPVAADNRIPGVARGTGLRIADLRAAAGLERRRRCAMVEQGSCQRREHRRGAGLRRRFGERRLHRAFRAVEVARIRAHRQPDRPPVRRLGDRQRGQLALLRAGAWPHVARRPREHFGVLSGRACGAATRCVHSRKYSARPHDDTPASRASRQQSPVGREGRAAQPRLLHRVARPAGAAVSVDRLRRQPRAGQRTRRPVARRALRAPQRGQRRRALRP